ncbi:transcriptional regulator [uncultured Paraglaciecola sp.]|uniref:transcriptional regulator n=1 Tax=uncultured Paraglaciecola sp. TaxID=1765024 RepID=UPI0030DC2F4E|tara:strand:+ start:40548 stop:40850 length:303 start_codon:yes stop_codon:yes gene_type:complete
MTSANFDPLIHAQHRLQICAILALTDEIEFKIIREKLEVSDSVLSKHLKSLEEANYVQLTKRKEMGRQRTWLSLTVKGRVAFKAHVKALQNIVDNVSEST